jgi:hypothetical protein
MRLLLTVLALGAITPGSLLAQTRYSLGFGLTAGTKLAEDRIFQDITVAQRPAPTFTLGLSTPVSAKERGSLEVSLGFGQTRIKEEGEADADGPDFKTLGLNLGVDGPVIGPLRYRIGAGLIKYMPDKEGFFRQGGPLLLSLGIGADAPIYRRGNIGLVARLRYDYQRFSTDELRSAGFSRTQDVHRVGLGLAVEYSR